MKKIMVFGIVMVLLVVTVYGGGYMEPLTRGLANTLYCQVGGDCVMGNITVSAINLFNGSLNFINVTIINYNVTGELNIEGNISADNFIGNGSLITGITANSIEDVWVNETGDTMTGELIINANLSINKYLTHIGDSDTYIEFSGDDYVQMYSGGLFYIGMYESALHNYLYLGHDDDIQVRLGKDTIWINETNNQVDFSGCIVVDDKELCSWDNINHTPTVDSNASTACEDGEYLDGSGLCIKIASTYINATNSSIVTGTIDAGYLNNTQHSDGAYDGITLNFSEQVASPALDLRINFTEVESFNQGVMRYYTSNLFGDFPIIQMWNYDNSIWEDYPPVGESETFATITQPVFDSLDHIQDGVAQMRIYKASNGNTNNHYYVDWIALIKGFGTPSGEEIDPYYTEGIKNYYNMSQVNTTIDSYGFLTNGTDASLGILNITINQTFQSGSLSMGIWLNGSGLCIGAC